MMDLNTSPEPTAPRELAVHFTFSVAVHADDAPDTLEQCRVWAEEIADGMQQHHFPGDDIAACTALAGSEIVQSLPARWVGRVEAIEL